MSGVGEASTIFGLVTGSIDLLKLAYEISQAAHGNAPQRIKKVAEQLPSIEELLEDAQNTKGEHDEAWKAVATDVKTCETACRALKTIFDKACPKEGTSKGRRVWDAGAVIFTGKRTQAEEHLAKILNTLEVLKGKLIITNTRLLEDLKKAVDELDDKEGGINHWGSGDNNVIQRDGTSYKGDNGKIIGSIGTYNEPAPAKAPAG
jgi:hypothetical protein